MTSNDEAVTLISKFGSFPLQGEDGSKSDAEFAIDNYNQAIEGCEWIENNRSFLRHTHRKRSKIYESLGQYELAEKDRNLAKQYKD